jgi:hypothetical protein
MRETIELVLRWIHISAGSIGLIAFWVPVLSRKGGISHRRFGTVFKWCGYVVVASALSAVLLSLGAAIFQGVRPSDNPNRFGFALFLGYLGIVTGVMIRHGIEVLGHKRDITEMNRPLDRALAQLSIASSIGIAAFALYYAPGNRMALFALSPLGAVIGFDILQVISGRKNEGKNAWLLEHLAALLGAGIAFHTAFAVFGLSRLFDFGLRGPVAVIPWILPALIGIPAAVLWGRKYRNKPAPKTDRSTT